MITAYEISKSEYTKYEIEMLEKIDSGPVRILLQSMYGAGRKRNGINGIGAFALLSKKEERELSKFYVAVSELAVKMGGKRKHKRFGANVTTGG